MTQLVETFSEVGIGLVFRGGIPNLEPREEVRPTNSALLVRAGEGDSAEGVTAGLGFDAPFHTRGVLPLPADHWADWLFGRASSELILKPPKAGTLTATLAPRPSRKDQQNGVTQPTLF